MFKCNKISLEQIKQDNKQIRCYYADGRIFCVKLQDWEYLGSGNAHIILKYKYIMKEFNKVLIIRYKPTEQLEIFTETYHNILSQSKVNKFILPKIKLSVDTQDERRFAEYLASLEYCKIEVQCIKELFISQNLQELKNSSYNLVLEFKPKSALPDVYCRQTIEQIAILSSLSVDQIERIIKQAPQNEQTRWFKKNCLIRDKKNQDPTILFKNEQCIKLYPNNVKFIHPKLQIKCQKYLNQLLNFQLRKSQLLNYINQIQLLYTQSICQTYHYNNFYKSNTSKQITSLLLFQEIFNQLQNQKSLKFQNLQLIQNHIHHQLQTTSFQQMVETLKFLISHTFKDISIIIRAQLTQTQQPILIKYDIKIIDYELKPLSTIHDNFRKDKQFLLNYISYKNI